MKVEDPTLQPATKLDYRELRACLTSKGETSEDRSSHHVFYLVKIDGKLYRATKMSHSARGQISDQLLSVIAKEMRLKTKELKDFVDCTVTREDWLNLWKERGSSKG